MHRKGVGTFQEGMHRNRKQYQNTLDIESVRLLDVQGYPSLSDEEFRAQ